MAHKKNNETTDTNIWLETEHDEGLDVCVFDEKTFGFASGSSSSYTRISISQVRTLNQWLTQRILEIDDLQAFGTPITWPVTNTTVSENTWSLSDEAIKEIEELERNMYFYGRW